MHTFLQIASEYPPTLILNLYAYDGRLEVFVFDLPQQFLETQLIHPEYVAYTRYQLPPVLTKRQWYVLTGSGVDEFEFSPVFYEAVGLDEADRAGPRGELHIESRTQDQEGVRALLATQSRTDEMREDYLIVLEFLEIERLQFVRVDYADAGGELVHWGSWVADLVVFLL